MKLLPGVDHKAREEVVSEVTQRLHNYVAGTMTLVDHSRRLLRGRSGAVVDEFSGKLATVLENPEIVFVQDLRNFMLHRSLPLIAHRLRLSGGDGETTQGRSDLLLKTADLLAWDNWTRSSRNWLDSQTEDVRRGPLVVKHSELVYELNVWLLNSLTEENRPALAEANKIIDERNTWFNREPGSPVATESPG